MKSFLTILTLGLIILAVALPHTQAQDDDLNPPPVSDAESNFLMLDVEFDNSEVQTPKFMYLQGFGFLIFGIYLIGASLTIFFAHRFKLTGLVAAEILICIYILWFLLAPYLWALLLKKRQLDSNRPMMDNQKITIIKT